MTTTNSKDKPHDMERSSRGIVQPFKRRCGGFFRPRSAIDSNPRRHVRNTAAGSSSEHVHHWSWSPCGLAKAGLASIGSSEGLRIGFHPSSRRAPSRASHSPTCASSLRGKAPATPVRGLTRGSTRRARRPGHEPRRGRSYGTGIQGTRQSWSVLLHVDDNPQIPANQRRRRPSQPSDPICVYGA